MGDCLAVDEERCAGLEHGEELLARLRELVDVAPWTGPAMWIHGDLHTANILADDSHSADNPTMGAIGDRLVATLLS